VPMSVSCKTLLAFAVIYLSAVAAGSGYVEATPPVTDCTYFVSPDGSDSNPGTSDRRFRTVSKAASVARPGISICVEDGVYPESVWLHTSGLPGAWITFRSLHMHGARIAPTAAARGNDAFNLNSQSYITISGFNLTAGPTSSGVAAGWGGLGHHTRVINNLIHDTGASGIQLNSGDYRTIENNIVYRCALSAPFDGSGISIYEPKAVDSNPGYHNIIRHNIAFANDNLKGPRTDGNGIILDDTRSSQVSGVRYRNSTLIENNLSFGNGGNGIEVFHSDYVTIRNNTAYWNNRRKDSRPDRGELANVSSSHVIWVNNIGWTKDASEAAIIERGFARKVVWAGNITFSSKPAASLESISDYRRWRIKDENFFGLDPQLVNPGLSLESDFRPASFGPAVNKGVVRYGIPGMDGAHDPAAEGETYIGAYAPGTRETAR
jgi:parallel beta-helix repeat protein